MIATPCDGTRNCKCGATGCPDACAPGFRVLYMDSGVTIITCEPDPKPKYQGEDLSFMFSAPFIPPVPQKILHVYPKRMFSKSGYLPKRIRRRFKSAQH